MIRCIGSLFAGVSPSAVVGGLKIILIVTRRSVLAVHLISTGLPVSIRQGLVDVLPHLQKKPKCLSSMILLI